MKTTFLILTPEPIAVLFLVNQKWQKNLCIK